MEIFDNIIIYTDGACSNNGKKNAVGGCGVYFPNKEFTDISLNFKLNPITNNRAELYAIYLAVKTLDDTIFKTSTIYSDSKYAINCVTSWYDKWEKNKFLLSNKNQIKNFDIITDIHNILVTHTNITFKYIERGKNTFADKLAKDAKEL